MQLRTITTLKRVATGLRLSLGILAITVAYAAALSQVKAAAPSLFWPPVLDHTYPDLVLFDQNGHQMRLSSLRGKIIIVEPIGMSCPACQAFSGANAKAGALAGVQPQPGLKSFEEYMKEYTGYDLSYQRVVFVQLVLYNQQMQPPTLADVQSWAKHFGMDHSANRMVLAGDKRFIGDASYNMIPGFQLIDQNFVLRSDSTGHNPRNDLWKHFFPTLKSLL